MAGLTGEQDGPERRTSRRRSRGEIPDLVAVKLQSEEVRVINASRGGILIECGLRLPPGSSSQIEFFLSDGSQRVRGTVVRCEVAAINAERLHYRLAIAFSREMGFIDGEPRLEELIPTFGADTELIVYLGDGGELESAHPLNEW